MRERPRAFRLDRPDTALRTAEAGERIDTDAFSRRDAAKVLITEEPLEAIEAADGVPVLPEPRRRAPWGTILLASLGGLASLAIGLSVEALAAELFRIAPWLGWIAVALAALAVVALAAIVWREVAGVLRERRIEDLRARAAAALAVRDAEAAKAIARDVAALYTGGSRRRVGPGVGDVEGEIMDADDRLALAERTLIEPLDESAKRAVGAAARQVSLVTAVSPRAVVDVVFVVYAAAKLLRRVSRIYGARPGLLGFLRLARAAFNHLAVTGGVAVGDGLLQQALGLGLAARVSAKLGEGVVNGLMTARFGLAAIEVCRPLPFVRAEPPRIGDVAGSLLRRDKADD